MGITIKAMIDKQLLKNVRLAAGSQGIFNEFSWVNVMEILDTPDSVQQGELLVTTGFRLQEKALYHDLIPRLKSRMVSGLAIQTGYYIDSIPDYILKAADDCNFPVLEFPQDLTFSEILHVLIDEINQASLQESSKDTARQAYQALSQLIASNSNILFDDDSSTFLFYLRPISDFSGKEDIMDKCLNKLRSYLSVQTPNCCHQLLDDGSAVFLLSFTADTSYQPMLYELNIQLTYISEQNGINYYIGVEKLSSADQQSSAFEHALECIRLLKSITARRGVCSYENLTFVRMFGMLHQSERSIVLDNHALQILLNFDRQNQTNYVHTLRTYLADNCNISRTAERLFIHRHTLMKRLDKIRDLSGINFNDYYARIYMSLALLFHDYFAY